MPINKMTVGKDYSISFYDGQSGVLIDLGDVQNVQITALKHDIKSMPYNDVPRFGYIPDGYKIDFTITRTGAQLEDFFVAAAAAFDNGQVQQPGFLNESILNSDGSTSRYQYTGFVTFLVDHGNISREKTVTLKLEGMASKKVAIA